jgi:OTU domain-containing protein 3
MASDGNCLFRSLSDQLYWDYGKCHEEIRSDICDFLASHEADFKMFLVLDEEDEDAADFESYISNMRECGEWGGNLELVAAARLYQ